MKSFSIGEKKLAKSYVVSAENADNAVGDDEENEDDARMKDSNTKSIDSRQYISILGYLMLAPNYPNILNRYRNVCRKC